MARNLGKHTQTFANLVCVEISSPPTLKVAISDPESVDNGIDVGQDQLKIDPKFVSDCSQRTLSLRDPGQKNFTLKASDFASFDGDPRGISSHSTGRRAANHGVVSP